jgi:hypothetical protein
MDLILPLMSWNKIKIILHLHKTYKKTYNEKNNLLEQN